MNIKDILNEISKKQGVSDYKRIPISSWKKFQKSPMKNIIILNKNISLDSDNDFLEFYSFLNSIFISRVNLPTAFRILNNAYF